MGVIVVLRTNFLSTQTGQPEPPVSYGRRPIENPRNLSHRIAAEALPLDVAFLHRYGVGLPVLHRAASRAKLHDVTAAKALIATGAISEDGYYWCVAYELGLEFASETPVTEEPFLNTPNPADLERMLRKVAVDGETRTFHIAPDMRHAASFKQFLERRPHLRSRLRVTTPSANRKALEKRSEQSLLRSSIDRLANISPDLSARQVITVSQAIFVLLLLQALALIAFFSSGWVVLALHLTATMLYISCVLFRCYAAFAVNFKARRPAPFWKEIIDREGDGELPVYSVLIALYKEEGQVDDLVTALAKLDWPREKLEIKLICEADDAKTIAAVRAAIQRIGATHIRLVSVPVQQPRTKPKALNYALPLCRGRLLVVYDAEDRPDPLQLREAYAAFKKGSRYLACMQAPLVIHNHGEHWLSRMFTIEYSSLFDGLLPTLARHKLPVPLGGTSNHFKRAVLEQVGGWDPYNVTEDADLGIRLARAGYQVGVIARPTYEEAPISFPVWLKQRTRWFKGWLQTWLVHMRKPAALGVDLGWGGSVMFHIMVTGMIVSALIHPLLLFYIGMTVWHGWQFGWSTTFANPLLWLDIATVLFGYFTFALLAWRTLPVRGLSSLRRSLIGIPAYWLLLSMGAWRAVWHLIWRPHEWEKTPHRLRRKRPDAPKNGSRVPSLN